MPYTASITSQRAIERQRAETECKEVCLRYSLPALFGNWFENKHMVQVKADQLSGRLARGETFLQKKDIVLKYLFEPGEIAKYNEYLIYDVPILLVTALEIPLDEDKDPETITQLALSTMIIEKEIDANHLTLGEGCILTATERIEKRRKTIYCFVNADPAKAGKPIAYEEELFIRLYDSGTPEILYLRCEVPHLDGFGMDKQRFLIRFTNTPDRYCKFKIMNRIANIRFLSTGNLVRSDERILICHVLSNRCLGVELKDFVETLIMGKERLVSCYNYRDIYRQFTSENLWLPVTRKLGEDARQMDAEKEEREKNARIAEETNIKKKLLRAERRAMKEAGKL